MDSIVTTHRPVKRLGQNFLKDLKIAERIISLASIDIKDTVLEPGAGRGILTRLLEDLAGRVIAVEKDNRLAAQLRKTFSTSPSVEVVEGDVLKTQLPEFNKVVGTPPYYISSKLVLLLQGLKFESAYLVFQKEFAERLVARPGTSDYGRLSVTAQRKMRIRSLLDIPRQSFDPKPKVDSILVSLQPKPRRSDVDEQVFGEMVRAIFTQRRRIARGVMFHYLRLKLGAEKARTILLQLRVPNSRVHELSITELEDLAVQLTGLGVR